MISVMIRLLLVCAAFLPFLSTIPGQEPAPAPGAAEPKLELVVQTGHKNRMWSVALSADGRLAITASQDNSAILWDTTTGNQLRSIQVGGVTRSVAISANGSRFATSGHTDGTSVIWDTKSGQKISTIKGDSVTLSEDGRLAVTNVILPENQTADICCWNADNGAKLKTIAGRDWFGFFAVSGNGRRILTRFREMTDALVVLDSQTGEKLQTLEGVTGRVDGAALSSDGRRALTISDLGAVIWDTQIGKKLRTLSGPDFKSLATAVLSSDGRKALTGSFDRTAILWDVEAGEKIRSFSGITDSVLAVALSKDGRRALTAIADANVVIGPPQPGLAILWDAQSGERLESLTGRTSEVWSIALSLDGRRVVVGSADKSAAVWDLQAGKFLCTLSGHTTPVRSVAVTADGRRVITSNGKTGTLWNVETGKQLGTFTDHVEFVNRVAMSENGRRALTVGVQRPNDVGVRKTTATLWDADNGTRLRSFDVYNSGKNYVAMSNDGRRLITLSDSRTIAVWDAETGAQIKSLSVEVAVFNGVAISADGRRIAGSMFKEAANGKIADSVTVWDSQSGQKIREFTGHAGSSIMGVALSPDGHRIAAVTNDGTALLWDVDTEDKVKTFSGGMGVVLSAALSSDGQRLLTASIDGATRIWNTATGKELCSLISIDAGKDWLVVTPDGLFDGSPDATRFLSYRISGTLDFVPLERYQQKYWRPGLLAQIMKGEKPEPTVNINRTLPPKVRFAESLKPGMELKSNTLTVEAIAETRSNFPVKAFRLLVDGRPYRGQFGVVKVPEPKVGESRAKWDIELEPGRHTLKVMVDTEYVQGASDEIEVKYVGGGGGAVERPALYILAVGISDYPDATRKLDYAHLDAAGIAETYRTHSKALFKEIDAKVITDRAATRKGIFAGMQWLREKMAAKPNSVGVLFFAGHGEKDKGDGSLYFLPVDFEEKDLAGSAIDADTMKKQLASIPGRLMLILDACHSGDIGKEKTRSAGELTDQLLRDLTAEDNGLIVLCSALGHQKAQESREFKHGMFTLAMMEAIQGKAAKTNDGAVYLDSMIAYVGNRVRDLTKGYQSPVAGRPIAIRDFPISKP